MIVFLDRFPRAYAFVAIIPLAFIAIGGATSMQGIGICLIISVATVLFIFSGLQRVTFDLQEGVMRYYSFFCMKTEIPLQEIEDWDSCTTSKTTYKDGKRNTTYTYTVTVYSKDGDSHSFDVFTRQKIKEFDIKMRNALEACGIAA